MFRLKVPEYVRFLLLVMFVLLVMGARQVLQARGPQPQNPAAAGTTVVVRMIDAVDSASDPAGKQYRASVTTAANAGNGVTILQGAAAAVTLANSSTGSGWTAQLASVVINGQPTAVNSSSARVTGAAQNAASTAASAANSALRRLGRPQSVPSTVAAVASGARVLLPPGTTLSFTLDAMQPGSAPVAAAGAAPVSQPTAAATPVAASSPVAASNGGVGGNITAMNICFSNPPPNPSDPNHKTEYLTAAFEVPVDTLRAIPVLEPAFSTYLKATYQYPSAGITCQPIWSVADAQTVQKKIISGRDSAKLKIVNTGWRYGQPPLVQGQSGFDPLAQGPGGFDLSQHRLTTYYCTLTADGGTSMVSADPSGADRTAYVSPIFQADWDSGPVNNSWYLYIRDHYVHDLAETVGPGAFCVAESPAIAAMMHPGAGVSKLIHHIVPVDWTDTPAQAAAGNVAAAQAASATASAAVATGGPFISCSTAGGPGTDAYFTGVFQTTRPIKRMPNGAVLVDQSILDHFYAYLTQKGYKFKPGSNSGCDVKPTEAEAKAAQHTRAYGGNGGTGYRCTTCGAIIETGWKDTQ